MVFEKNHLPRLSDEEMWILAAISINQVAKVRMCLKF